MTDFFIRHFIKDCKNTSDPNVRLSYGIMGGIIGISANLLLFIVKVVAGAMSHSIAIISDGFNNLSDMGSSFVSVIGTRLSGKRADSMHPYGHGRAEYISALIISFLILFFGLELLKNSILKFFNPTSVSLNVLSVCLLVLSMIIKIWMWRCNKRLAYAISSEVLDAAAKDSLNDCFSTVAVLISACLANFTTLPIDAAAGVCVSTMILYTGFGIAKSTINRLLGTAPNPELTKKIETILTENPEILGMHDLMIHDYGPGKKIASVHAEIKSNLTLCDVHYIIDKTEHRIMDETGVDIVIHPDPIACVFPALSDNKQTENQNQ